MWLDLSDNAQLCVSLHHNTICYWCSRPWRLTPTSLWSMSLKTAILFPLTPAKGVGELTPISTQPLPLITQG